MATLVPFDKTSQYRIKAIRDLVPGQQIVRVLGSMTHYPDFEYGEWNEFDYPGYVVEYTVLGFAWRPRWADIWESVEQVPTDNPDYDWFEEHWQVLLVTADGRHKRWEYVSSLGIDQFWGPVWTLDYAVLNELDIELDRHSLEGPEYLSKFSSWKPDYNIAFSDNWYQSSPYYDSQQDRPDPVLESVDKGWGDW